MMADSQINIIINTIKKGFGDKDTRSALKDLGKEFTNITGISLGWAGAISATVAIGKKLVDWGKQSISFFSVYANEIEKLTQLNGNSADSMSRLYQVADDLGIGFETLEKGLVAANKNGIDTSIDGLGRLSDEFLKLEPGQKQSKFLTDALGKSGTDWYKVMALGSEELKKRMNLVDKSLVLTEKDIKQNIDYKLAIDNVTDAINSQKIATGKGLIPIVQALITTETDENKIALQNIRTRIEAIKLMQSRNASNKELDDELQRLNKAEAEFSQKVDETSESNRKAAAFQEIANQKFKELQSIIGGKLGGEISSYNDKLADLTKNQSDLNSKYDYWKNVVSIAPQMVEELTAKLELLKSTTGENTDEYDETQKSLDRWKSTVEGGSGALAGMTKDIQDNKDAITKLKEEHEIAMRTMAYNMLVERAASDGLTENELANLTTIGRAWGLYDQKTADVIDAINSNLDELDTSNPQNLLSILEKILTLPDSKSFRYDINYVAHYTNLNWNPDTGQLDGGPAAPSSGSSGGGTWVYAYTDASGQRWEKRLDADGSYSYRKAMAAGGNAFANSVYLVGEKGPELFVPKTDGYVVSNSDLQAMQKSNPGGGGGGPVIITNHFEINGVSDARAVAVEVKNILERQIKLQVQR